MEIISKIFCQIIKQRFLLDKQILTENREVTLKQPILGRSILGFCFYLIYWNQSFVF